MAHLTPGQRVFYPRLYSTQEDRMATVVRVVESTRQLWVIFDGSDKVREISTFHVRPLRDGEPDPANTDPSVQKV